MGGSRNNGPGSNPPPAPPAPRPRLTVAPGRGGQPAQHNVTVPPTLQVLCVSRFTLASWNANNFNVSNFQFMVGVAVALQARLNEINQARTTTRHFTPVINWVLPDIWLAQGFTIAGLPNPPYAPLQAWDIIVYFLLEQTDSLIVAVTHAHPPGDPAGLTANAPGGVIAEVYVDGNLPPGKLGNIAMHEIMHLKLDIGQHAVPDIHALNTAPARGMSSPGGVEEWTTFTAVELQQMGAHILDPVAVFRDGR
jgi:hypothetical protein